jgi:hypothetical protein
MDVEGHEKEDSLAGRYLWHEQQLRGEIDGTAGDANCSTTSGA